MTTWTPLPPGTEGVSYVDLKQNIVVKHAKKWPFTCLYWKDLNHKNIQQLLRVEETKDKDLIYTEYITGTELFETILNNEYIKIVVKVIIMRQIVDGIQYLHQQNIAHMDIKPENIIVSNDFKTVKIIDLNGAIGMKNCFVEDLCRELKKSDENKENLQEETGHLYSCGTRDYMAPEIITISECEQNKSVTMYTRKEALDIYKTADICSLGKTFLALLSHSAYPYEKNCYLTRNIINIIGLMINKDPKKRPDIEKCAKLLYSDDIHLSSFSLE